MTAFKRRIARLPSFTVPKVAADAVGSGASAGGALNSAATGLNVVNTGLSGAGCLMGSGTSKVASCVSAVAGIGGVGSGLAASGEASGGLLQLNQLYAGASVAGLLPSWEASQN